MNIDMTKEQWYEDQIFNHSTIAVLEDSDYRVKLFSMDYKYWLMWVHGDLHGKDLLAETATLPIPIEIIGHGVDVEEHLEESKRRNAKAKEFNKALKADSSIVEFVAKKAKENKISHSSYRVFGVLCIQAYLEELEEKEKKYKTEAFNQSLAEFDKVYRKMLVESGNACLLGSRTNTPPKKPVKSIDNVTTTNMDLACRMAGMHLGPEMIDKIIDLVDLLEEHGDDISIKDVLKLKSEWDDSKME